MMTSQPDFSVPEETSERLREKGRAIVARLEAEDFRCSDWKFEEDLSSESKIVEAFMVAQSMGDEIFFINLEEEETTGSLSIFADDFLIRYSGENFLQVFEDSIFAAQRIISSSNGSILVASYKDWGVLSQ